MLSFNQSIKKNTDEFIARLVEAGWNISDAKIEVCEQLHENYWAQMSHDFSFTLKSDNVQDFECNACGRKFRMPIR